MPRNKRINHKTKARIAFNKVKQQNKLKKTTPLNLNINSLMQVDDNIRFYGLWAGSICFLVITLILGPTGAALFLLTVGGLAYAIYQEKISNWMNQHEWVMPIALGFYVFSGFNLIGLAAGLMAGYFINLQFNRAKNLAHSVADSTEAVRHPINFTTKKATGAWHGLKNVTKRSYHWLMRDEKIEPSNNNPQNLAEIPNANLQQANNSCDVVDKPEKPIAPLQMPKKAVINPRSHKMTRARFRALRQMQCRHKTRQLPGPFRQNATLKTVTDNLTQQSVRNENLVEKLLEPTAPIIAPAFVNNLQNKNQTNLVGDPTPATQSFWQRLTSTYNECSHDMIEHRLF